MYTVTAWLKKASTRFVFFGFSAVMLILVGLYIGLVVQ